MDCKQLNLRISNGKYTQLLTVAIKKAVFKFNSIVVTKNIIYVSGLIDRPYYYT